MLQSNKKQNKLALMRVQPLLPPSGGLIAQMSNSSRLLGRMASVVFVPAR